MYEWCDARRTNITLVLFEAIIARANHQSAAGFRVLAVWTALTVTAITERGAQELKNLRRVPEQGLFRRSRDMTTSQHLH